MAILAIAQLGDPVLRVPARPLTPDEIGSAATRRLIEDMIETMRDADGAGLAAPQVYASLQVCVIELTRNKRYPDLDPIALTVLINPVVTPLVTGPLDALREHESMFIYEGCLSVAGLRGRVQRPRKVHVRALDAAGQPFEVVWEGFRAAVIQHEVDHLNATLFVDRAQPGTLTFLREYERYVPADQRVVDGALRTASF